MAEKPQQVVAVPKWLVNGLGSLLLAVLVGGGSWAIWVTKTLVQLQTQAESYTVIRATDLDNINHRLDRIDAKLDKLTKP